MEEKEVNNPIEVKDEKQAMIAQLERVKEAYADRITPEVYLGLQTAVEEYYNNKENIAKRKIEFGSNPLDYYGYKTNRGEGLVDSKKYYDIDKADSSNISQSDLYKMFSVQVIDQLKKGRVITLPESYDIGAHYSSVGKALNSSVQSQMRDLTSEQLRDVSNKRYAESMQERLDYLINNTKAEDLYNTYNPETASRYQKKYKSNAALLIGSLTEKIAGKKLEPDHESNTADAFNRLLSASTGGGRSLGKDVYFDAQGNPVDVEPYVSEGMNNSKKYKQGYEQALQRDPSKPIEESIAELYGKDTGKGTEFVDFQQGFFDRLQEQGTKVYRKKGTKGTEGVAVMDKIKINLNYKDGVLGRSVNIGESGKEIDYMDLPDNMRNYVDRVSYLEKLTGDSNTATTQGGVGYAPV